MSVKYDKILGSLREGDDGSGGGGGGAVDSVFGRTGVVVAASGDYGSDEITNDSGVAGATVTDALNNIEQGIPAWESVTDTVYTVGSPFSVTGGAASVVLPNNSGSRINTYMPSGIKFYNESTQKITPQTVGEIYQLRINFKSKSSTVNNYLVLSLDIGGSQGIILERVSSFPRGANVEHSFSSSNTLFALSTFITNGGDVKVYADDNIEIYDISFLITRTSIGDINLPDAPSDGDLYGRLNGDWSNITTQLNNKLNISDATGFKSIALTSGNIDLDGTYSTGFPEYYANSGSSLGGALPTTFGQLVSYKLSSARLFQYYYPKNTNEVYFRAFDYDTANDFNAWVELTNQGGASLLESSAISITEGSWNGNTNYSYTVTVTGAAVGDNAFFVLPTTVYDNIRTAGARLYDGMRVVSSANTVRIDFQVSTFVSIPASSTFKVYVLK